MLYFRRRLLIILFKLSDMFILVATLVGPRPLPVRDYKGFGQDWQRRRFSVLPGITCTWQISGRNNLSFEDWMKLDMGYIDNWKLSEDLKILLLTVAAVIGRNGAE